MESHFKAIKAELTLLDYLLEDKKYEVKPGTYISCRNYNGISLYQFTTWINKYYIVEQVKSGDENQLIYKIHSSKY